MSTLVLLTEFKRYPDMHVSKKLSVCLKRDGLIEPLVRMPNGNLHERELERGEAFQRLVDDLISTGIKATPYLLVCNWNDMTKNEQEEYL